MSPALRIVHTSFGRPTGARPRRHTGSWLAALILAGGSACGGDGGPSNSVAPPPSDPVVSVTVEPEDVLIPVNDSRHLDVTIRTQRGSVVNKPVTWSSSDPSVATVDGAGNVNGKADGSTTIVARVDGVEGSTSVVVRKAPPPPPANGLHFSGDFSSFTDDATLHAFAGTKTQGNVHADPGKGMRYDFQPRPQRCGDQSLASQLNLPSGTKEVWIRFRIRFSSNWTTQNANCESPAPEYKMVLTWLDKDPHAGHPRFDLRHSPGKLTASVPGFPGADAVPVAIAWGDGVSGDDIFDDGKWHDIEMHQALIGDDVSIIQLRIDGTVTHNYRTQTTTGLYSRWLAKLNIGANRNLGATELMQIWWDDFEVWVGDNPGGFFFPAPTEY